MRTNLTPKRWFWIVLLIIPLAACTPAQTDTTDVQSTVAAVVLQTNVALTQAAHPTTTPGPTPTTLVLPTPIPTLPPPPILTPDAIQIERWQEYQTELAKVLLYGYGPDAYKDALCEWDILGRSGQEVYAWVSCAIQGGGGGRRPAVIHLAADGSIQKVGVPAINNSTWDSQIQTMFPPDVIEKFDLYTGDSLFNGRTREMLDHITYREAHPGEPPLVVLSAIPTVTPTP
jgi:hypothetical protein